MSAVADPTTEQLADLRDDLGDTATTPALTDDRLARAWQRAGGKHYGTCLIVARQLANEAVRFHDYAFGQGQSDQKKSQLHANAAAMVARFAPLAASERTGGMGFGSIRLGTATAVCDDDEDEE